MCRDGAASDLWGRDHAPENGMYHELTRERYGMFGGATARAAPQVLRLALVYALLDRASEIQQEHLLAGHAVWRYCEDSARYIFGDSLGDPVADEILRRLRQSLKGLTRTEIRGCSNENKSLGDSTRRCCYLHKAGLACFEMSPLPADRRALVALAELFTSSGNKVA